MRKPFQFSRPTLGQSSYDQGVILGCLIIVLLFGLSLLSAGGAGSFLNILGLAIVLGGTFAAVLIQYGKEDVFLACAAAKGILHRQAISAPVRVRQLLSLSHAVKRSGLVVLDHEAQKTRDPFFRVGLELASDHHPASEIRRILEQKQDLMSVHEQQSVRIIETAADYAPALGLIGTLLGLVQLMGSLSTPEAIGPAMSVALLTTLYGAVLSNLVLSPLAGRLQRYMEQEQICRALTIEGIGSLAQEESTVVLEQRLQGFRQILQREAA